MNSKVVLLLALAALALQAQAFSVPGRSWEELSLDTADKDDLQVGLNGVLNGPRSLSRLQQQSIGPYATRFMGLTDILEALRGYLSNIEILIGNVTAAVEDVINKVLQNALNVAQNTIDGWDKNLRDAIKGIAALNATIEECKAVKPTLRDVGDDLSARVKDCVDAQSNRSQNALSELTAYGDEMKSVIEEAQKEIEECKKSGFFLAQLNCVILRTPGLLGRGIWLAGDAARTATRVSATLLVEVPARATACVTATVADHGVRAAAVIARTEGCILAGGTTTTAEGSSTTASPASTTAPATSTSATPTTSS